MKNQKYVISSRNKELMSFLKCKNGILRELRLYGIEGVRSSRLGMIRDAFGLPNWDVKVKSWLKQELQIREVKIRKYKPKLKVINQEKSFGGMLKNTILEHNKKRGIK